MADTALLTKRSLKTPPLRVDSTAMGRQSLDMSSSRSSVQSSQVHTPSSSAPSTPLISARAPSPERQPLHPEGSNSFLTALAAQERRVLELKEELQKAEGELGKLKKQWASHEAAKKRNELPHLEQLQPLKTTPGGSGLLDDSDARFVTRGLHRRTIAPPSTKSSQRTVFSGSRHARTLSLLSPKDSITDPPVLSRSFEPRRRNRDLDEYNKNSTTKHELGTSTDGLSRSDRPSGGPPKDLILETGKQLVGDFRQGLWTFFEDLKQVTVGDEAASVSDPRCQHTLPAEGLPKTQTRRKRGSLIKETFDRRGDVTDGSILARNRRAEPSRCFQQPREVDQAQRRAPPSSVSASTDSETHGNTNSNSSDSDDDGCTYISRSNFLRCMQYVAKHGSPCKAASPPCFLKASLLDLIISSLAL